MIHKIYLKLLQKLCRYELKKIGKNYPNTLTEVIRWHDFMAFECIEPDTETKDNILGMCLSTNRFLDENPQGAKGGVG